MSAEETPAPLLRVVRGEPTEEELAALVAVMTAAAAGARASAPTFSLWARKSRSMRAAMRPGFGAWRGSMMPR